MLYVYAHFRACLSVCHARFRFVHAFAVYLRFRAPPLRSHLFLRRCFCAASYVAATSVLIRILFESFVGRCLLYAASYVAAISVLNRILFESFVGRRLLCAASYVAATSVLNRILFEIYRPTPPARCDFQSCSSQDMRIKNIQSPLRLIYFA
jgi:hypothetical protein